MQKLYESVEKQDFVKVAISRAVCLQCRRASTLLAMSSKLLIY